MTMYELLHSVVTDLDADGSGFRTREAANLVYARASEGRTDIPTLVERLARSGARVEIAQYRPEHEATKRAAAAVAAGQRDLAEVSEDFNHWITDIAALDESFDAVRKRVLRMTYPEFVQMIELRELKAAQMREYARRGRQVIAEHPDWQDNPSMTLAEVLGVSE
jgi:molecular chaperone GrpE (heat shock protein)